MSEMPATNLFDIMDELDPREQLDKMLVLLRSALMNPNDWDMHLKSMSARGMQQLLGMWSETVFDEGEQRGKKKSR
jgi:regulator of sirC expression with transglutaminase-like and TPR domain